jgi:hypothetical protein
MSKGVRLNPKHDEKTRLKIQTSQIINRLNSFVKGEVEMTTAQIRAAEILLKKSLPDLQSVEYVDNTPEENKSITVILRDMDEVERDLNQLT